MTGINIIVALALAFVALTSFKVGAWYGKRKQRKEQ